MALVNPDEVRYRGSDGCELHASVLGAGTPLVLLHGGGPDRRSFVPLARRLTATARTILPDIRGFGESVCREPARHTWQQYADDVVALLDHLQVESAVVGGGGMGSGIAMRTGLSAPDRVAGLVLLSPEHKGERRPTPEQVAWQERIADTIRTEGVEVGWASVFPMMPEGMAAMVRDAFARTDPASQGTALHAIAAQEPFERLDDLGALEMPVLVIPGSDDNHPRELGAAYHRVLPNCAVVDLDLWAGVQDAEGFALRVAPVLERYLDSGFFAKR